MHDGLHRQGGSRRGWRKECWQPDFNAETQRRKERLLAQQMFDHHLVERLVVSPRDQLAHGLLIERTRLFDEQFERSPAVEQMIHPMLRLGGAEGMHVEAHILAVLSVAVALQSTHLIEG